jgi:hypothetical protein
LTGSGDLGLSELTSKIEKSLIPTEELEALEQSSCEQEFRLAAFLL